MADPWGLTVGGLARFNDDIRKLPGALHTVADKANKRAAEGFQRVVKRNAPRSEDGPHIADTIEMLPGDPTKAEYFVRIGDDHLYYAVPLEFGHEGPDGKWVEGEHFWLPAQKIHVRRHRRSLARAIMKAIKTELGL